ncbi:MAG: phosphatase PAP2 family protein [Eubacterium sp.]
MIKRYKNEILLFYSLSVCALIAAAFLDLKLDIWINMPENPVALWFRNTGEIPCRLICPLAGAVLFYANENKLQGAVGFLFTLGGSAYLGYYIGKYFFADEYQMLFSIIWGIGFGLTVLFTGSFITIKPENKKVLRILAVIGIAVMAVQLLSVEGLKYLWGRVRFRDLIAEGSYDKFTPWYVINGINGNKSFPSGHTAGAGMSYLMMLLPLAFDKLKDKKAACFAIPFIYTSVVAVTRLMMGAHYLSDVTAGGIISFSLVLIAIKIYEKASKNTAVQTLNKN